MLNEFPPAPSSYGLAYARPRGFSGRSWWDNGGEELERRMRTGILSIDVEKGL